VPHWKRRADRGGSSAHVAEPLVNWHRVCRCPERVRCLFRKRRPSSTILHLVKIFVGGKSCNLCEVALGRRAMHATLDCCSTPPRVAPRANNPCSQLERDDAS